MIRFIRSFTVLFFFLFFGVGALTISFIIIPCASMFIKKQNRRKYFSNLIHKIWKFFINLLEKTESIKIVIENEQRLKNLSGKIITASHPSYIDIVILIGKIPNCICIAKKELKKNPIMSNIVKNIYIVNDEDKEKFIKESKELLEQGFNIIIFPTGTRTSAGQDLKLHKGAALLALHTKAEILPVSIKTDYPFLQKNQKIYDAGEKTVTYNLNIKEPIKPEEFLNKNQSEIKLRKMLTQKIKEEIS